ncbi:ATP-binding protein [Orenia marismortui]|uniref:ATP-binding protein n=1 Tax=Orenia marismortui TaxID=46469 RepID=UPI00036B8BD6|nr:ATP-binding protein [Orenia marismortui]
MKEIRLASLKLKNFKGIKDFEILDFSKNTKILGDNGTGKTSLFDAFSWLLFDKDSQGNSTQSFDIKTLDEEGNVIHGLEHEVEGVLQINEKKLTLRKTYYEKWTKQRGSAEKKFTGHTTDYFLNEVPVKKSEYDARINEIVDEDIFKLLTNPAHFNEELHWKEQRKILFKIAGDVDSEEVIAAAEGLDDLQSILGGKKIEDHKKIIETNRKKINKELDKIPVRIDETKLGMPDISNLDKKEINDEITGLKMRKSAKEKKISNIENGGEIAKKKKELAELQCELMEIKSNHRSSFDDEIEQNRAILEELRDKYRSVNSGIKDKEQEIKTGKQRIEKIDKEISKLRTKWHEVNKKELKFEQEDVCPTCGQDVPQEQLEETREKAIKEFNLDKSNQLAEINSDGKSKAEYKEIVAEKNENLKADIKDLESKAEKYQEEAEKIQAKLIDLKAKAKAVTESEDYQSKLEEKEKLEEEIKQLQEDKSQSIDEVKEQIYLLEKEIESNERKLSQIEQYEKGQERIQELADQEKKLAKEFSKLERELFLVEEFIRTKVELLDKKVNSKFKYAKFKLFEEQVNGGVKPTCETLFGGVPYGSSLNSAAKIKVGLDIINTLSEHYKFKAPVFIDNTESISEFTKPGGKVNSKSQVVTLIVNERVSELVTLKEGEVDIDKFIKLFGIEGAIERLFKLGEDELVLKSFSADLIKELGVKWKQMKEVV